jgi:hypothetical protein
MRKILSAAVLSVLMAGSAGAQAPVPTAPLGLRSNARGFMLNGHLNGSALSVEGENTESGGGLGLKLGYGFTDAIAIVAALDGAIINGEDGDDYALGHFDLGLQFNLLGPASAFRPYALIAFSSRAAIMDVDGDDLNLTGTGPTFGGGFRYFFRPALAVDVALSLTGGGFSEAEFKGQTEELDVDARSSRFNVGLSWQPQIGTR